MPLLEQEEGGGESFLWYLAEVGRDIDDAGFNPMISFFNQAVFDRVVGYRNGPLVKLRDLALKHGFPKGKMLPIETALGIEVRDRTFRFIDESNESFAGAQMFKTRFEILKQYYLCQT